MKIKLAICVIVKNEAPYMKEWIDYHRLVGVEKFYVYDNESTDSLLSVLAPYIYKGIVEYNFIEGKARQMDAYNDCLKSHRDDTEWLAIIDADEFIVPVGKFSLPKVLEEYKEYPGVGVNWVMFDYNKHIKKIPGGY